MAYDLHLAERINMVLKDRKVPFEEKKMMGGVCFMVNDKMCVGVIKENMMVRLDPEIQEQVMRKEGCREMDFTKRPLKGFVILEPKAIDMDEDLEYWIQLALEFNPKAKSSKKK